MSDYSLPTWMASEGRAVDPEVLVQEQAFVVTDEQYATIGRVLAYSEHPQFLIETPLGERVWWQVRKTRPASPTELAEALHVAMDDDR